MLDTTSSACDEPISAHIFTDIPPELFYKQAPGGTNTIGQVNLIGAVAFRAVSTARRLMNLDRATKRRRSTKPSSCP